MAKTRSKRVTKSAMDLVRTALNKQPVGACFDDVRRVARALYKGVNTPLSLSLLKALDSGDIDTIANCVVDPRSYDSPHAYFLDATASSFLRKFEALCELGTSTVLDPEGAAISSFFLAETQCRKTNERLWPYADGKPLPSTPVGRVISRAREFIMNILPCVPHLSDIEIRFGPGATSACKRESVTIADKLIAYPETTLDGRRFVNVVKNSPIWFDLMWSIHPNCLYKPRYQVDDYGNLFVDRRTAVIAPKILRGNRFTTVPKDAKKHRGICIEPHTLSCVQLAVGSILSDVLKEIGIQKDVTPVVHGRFALDASLDGVLATVDLSNASDTISTELVKLLLPWEWFEFLSTLRSPETCIDDEWVELEKFSSMGNGFTFELETLIFYALSRSVSDEVGLTTSPVSCFGDDIVISSACYPLLADVLAFCGFTINRDKSFSGCGFNESCGQDFFGGVDVRPYFLKKDLNYVTDWYSLVNGIYRLGTKHSLDGSLDPRFVPCYLRALSAIPTNLRLYGPVTDHNGWIWTDDRSRWTTEPVSGTERVAFKKLNRETGAIVVDNVTLPRWKQYHRYLAIVPQPVVRPLGRYCSMTQHASLLYGCKSGGFALRGDPLFLRPVWLAS